ncbi:MAG: hypothetical protein NT001_01520 [Candidatus Woesearchaeota archaeon]|nr:hypothetical protein [Candidatus Woesearchaeota archaeon]
MVQSSEDRNLDDFLDTLQEIYYWGFGKKIYGVTGIPDAEKGITILSARARKGTSDYRRQQHIIDSVKKFVDAHKGDLERTAASLYEDGQLPNQPQFVAEYTRCLMDLPEKYYSPFCNDMNSLGKALNRCVLLSGKGVFGSVAIQYFYERLPNIGETEKSA